MSNAQAFVQARPANQQEWRDVEDWSIWEGRFASFLVEQARAEAGHGLAHVQRVVANARRLADIEAADMEVVLPAAWLHDCVTFSKDAARRNQASRQAAATAGAFLREQGYPAAKVPAIEHAIEAHSFSAAIPPRTLEAMVVQDADRLDALGAIGIGRAFMVGGASGRIFYDPAEPFPRARQPDDSANIVDHFYLKLLKLAGSMNTAAGRQEARRRTAFMEQFLKQLDGEINATLDNT